MDHPSSIRIIHTVIYHYFSCLYHFVVTCNIFDCISGNGFVCEAIIPSVEAIRGTMPHLELSNYIRVLNNNWSSIV